MNVLYVIGNGFDIAHGYDTRYSEFYKYLKKNSDKYKKLLDICEEKDIDWSDFEIGFGEYIKKHAVDFPIDDFKQKIEDAYTALTDFLEDVIADIDNKVVVANSKYEVRYPFSYCEEEDEKILEETYASETNKFISVVCLNYTPLCEIYFEYNKVSNFIYLHGKLSSNPIFGVDNSLQLKTEKMSNEKLDKISKYFTKKSLVKKILKKSNADFRKKLDNANFIVIYGTSMGKSDETLWELLGKRVTEGAIVLYCCHSGYIDARNTIAHMDYVEEKKKWLCEKLKIDSKLYEDNLYITNAKYVFNFEFV